MWWLLFTALDWLYFSIKKPLFIGRIATDEFWMDKTMKKVRKWDKILAVAVRPKYCIFFRQFLIVDFYDMSPVLPDWWRHESLVSLAFFSAHVYWELRKP